MIRTTFALTVVTGLLGCAAPARGQSILIDGDYIRIYFSNNGSFNDPSRSRGFEVNHGGTFYAYTWPGTPHASTSFEWVDSAAQQYYVEQTNAGTNMLVNSFVDQSTSTVARAQIVWTAGNARITRTFSFRNADKFLFVDTTIQNNGTTAMTNFRAYDGIDPDQDTSAGFGASTANDTLALGGAAGPNWVQSAGFTTGRTIGYYSQQGGSTFGHYDSLTNVDADIALTDRGGATSDSQMGYRFNAPGNIAVGQSLTYRYMIAVGDTAAEAQAVAQANWAPVPEPTTGLGLAAIALGLSGVARRRLARRS